ncbi:MAG TPA: hypothetical protein VN745_04670 [Verrucomicrobiae bacterium]|nr:hypothetical protein [Verrucomicrobiae bacterium]
MQPKEGNASPVRTFESVNIPEGKDILTLRQRDDGTILASVSSQLDANSLSMNAIDELCDMVRCVLEAYSKRAIRLQ